MKARWQLLLEFKIDDIATGLWEALKLPNLKARVGPSEETTGSARAGIATAHARASTGAARSRSW